jgi:preprotein translocase subunit SecY
MWQTIHLVFKDVDLRRKFFYLFGILAVFRLAASVPLPNIDHEVLKRFFEDSQFLGLLNIFSGGGLSNVSIVMLGLGPYITASIIMQLLTMIFPRLKEIYQEEGEAGRQRFNQYSRILTIPLALIQGFSLLKILERLGVLSFSNTEMAMSLIVVAAGAVLLMWLGELISEYSIGNGASILIFAGIVAGLPTQLAQIQLSFDSSQLPELLLFAVIALVTIAAVVVISEGERSIPVHYAKRVRGMKLYGGVSTNLPLRVNQAGVIPIIFAVSILLFPQMFASFFASSDYSVLRWISSGLTNFLATTWLYGIFYFFLVFIFTYFYTAVTFDPGAISQNLQRSGAFVPGIRPGPSTTDFLNRVVTRITLVGALFLGAIAVLPIVMQAFTGIQSLTVGGTALLIVVSVVIETAKQIQAQLSLRAYD